MNRRSMEQTGLFLEQAAKLSNQGRRALFTDVTKNLMVTLVELQSSCVEMGETSRKTTINVTLHQSGGQNKSTSSVRGPRKHLKDSETVRNKILCLASVLNGLRYGEIIKDIDNLVQRDQDLILSAVMIMLCS